MSEVSISMFIRVMAKCLKSHVPRLGEGLATLCTAKYIGMFTHVHSEIVLPGEGLLADGAHEGRCC